MDIEVRNLSKKFGDRTVLENLSVVFQKGRVNALMGPSGSGKTTLIRIIMKLEDYDSGEIAGSADGKISAVFQEDRLCENLSAVKNVMLVCGKDVSKSEIVRELEKIGLKGSLKKPVRELSGGMKRRVAVVRSVMVKSDIVIFDEALKGLDPDTKANVIGYLKEKLKDRTVIMVTHDISEALAFEGNIIDIEKINNKQ